MFRINGYLQNYAWGIPAGLESWRSAPSSAHGGPGESVGGSTTEPQAELWFGAHPNGPSRLADEAGTLRERVDPDEVPLLVKLLAAARPLSIQIHPPTDQAQRQFAAQQADDSLPKLLADSLAKTEMLIAVRPFSVLQGLRDPQLSAAILHNVGGSAAAAANHIASGEVKTAIRALLAIDSAELEFLTAAVPGAASAAGVNAAGVEALTQVAQDYPGDAGVLVAALLDHQVLSVGQAVYVPAGVVHAYVTGIGVEVMTASDNVLRLGLTPKTIAIDEALEALDTRLNPEPMSGDPQPTDDGGVVRHFAPDGAPFTVDTVAAGSLTSESGSYRLVLAVAGDVEVAAGGDLVVLRQGEAAAVLAAEGAVSVTTSGLAAVARAT